MNDEKSLSLVVDAQKNGEQKVKAILGKKKSRRKVYNLVHLEDDSTKDAIWMHKSLLKNCQEMVRKVKESNRNV